MPETARNLAVQAIPEGLTCTGINRGIEIITDFSMKTLGPTRVEFSIVNICENKN
tara:strand:+ start:74 stop:238 length:165 start_codon:yes stop_codon:yes gene_type:complete